MKKISLISIASFILIFAGCSVPSTFYVPRADDSYTTLTSEDVYNVMIDNDKTYGFKSVPALSIISTTNKESKHHTILTYNLVDSSNFNSAVMTHSIFLSDDKVQLLNVEISKAITVWNNALSKQEAHDIFFQNVGEDTYFSFQYQHTSNGPVARVVMKQGRIPHPDIKDENYHYKMQLIEENGGFVSIYGIQFEELSEVQTLKLLLEKSLAN